MRRAPSHWGLHFQTVVFYAWSSFNCIIIINDSQSRRLAVKVPSASTFNWFACPRDKRINATVKYATLKRTVKKWRSLSPHFRRDNEISTSLERQQLILLMLAISKLRVGHPAVLGVPRPGRHSGGSRYGPSQSALLTQGGEELSCRNPESPKFVAPRFSTNSTLPRMPRYGQPKSSGAALLHTL